MSLPPSHSLNIAVIALDLCGILLLLMLLATPAPKHSLVNAFIVACLLRSTSDILPPIVHEFHKHAFQDIREHRPLLKFCVANTIVTSYFTVVKAAFTVSFTLPSLWLAIGEIEATKVCNSHLPRLRPRHVLTLCIAPFVWAVPVLFTPIPRLVNGKDLDATYSNTSCYFTDDPFRIASLILTIVPLALAVFISLTIIFILWRWKGSVFGTKWWASLRSMRGGGRFAALVLAITLSAEMYAAVTARWFREHTQQASDGLCIIMRVSIVWEAVTPIIFFFIFAAQAEIHEMWFELLRKLVPFRFRHRPSPTFISVSAAAHGTVTVHAMSHPDQQSASELYLKYPESFPVAEPQKTADETLVASLPPIMHKARIQEIRSGPAWPEQAQQRQIVPGLPHPPPSWSKLTARVRVAEGGKNEQSKRSRSYSHAQWQAASLTAVGSGKPQVAAEARQTQTSFLDLNPDSGRVSPSLETGTAPVGKSGRDSESPAPAPTSQVSMAGSSRTFG